MDVNAFPLNKHCRLIQNDLADFGYAAGEPIFLTKTHRYGIIKGYHISKKGPTMNLVSLRGFMKGIVMNLMKHRCFSILLLVAALGGILCGCDRPGDAVGEHTHAAASWKTTVEPTCSAEGLAQGECALCGTEMQMPLAKLSHTFTETVTPPTCEEAGVTRFTCACGYTYEGNPVSPTGHTLIKSTVQPTCEKEGYTRYACECGYVYDGDHVPSLGHTFTETVTPPTCEQEGYTRYYCDCGYTYDSNHIPSLGHTFTETVIPPTCEEEGYTCYTCECGYTYDGEHVAPTGHTLTEDVISPTCEEQGYTRYTCDCGYTYDTDFIPPAGHRLTETVTVPPTCTEEGYIRYECEVCDYEREGNSVPALAHANATAEHFYATVNRDGFTRHTCPDCGEVFEDTYISYKDIVSGAYVENTKILKQGIDTSKWNHEFGASLEDPKSLDWEALKAAGIDFVILKAGSTLGKDPAFELDYRDAKAAGLEVGAYFYAYSTTVEETLADAEMLLSWLEGKQFDLPIYFDMEETSMMALGGELLTELCVTFVERLQEAGYYAALYTNTEWLYNLLDTEWIKTNLDVWYARYTVSPPAEQGGFTPEDSDFPWKDGTAYKPGEIDKRYGLWQYTDSGMVEGFRYKFDFNYAFKDYKPIMVQWGLNGY